MPRGLDQQVRGLPPGPTEIRFGNGVEFRIAIEISLWQPIGYFDGRHTKRELDQKRVLVMLVTVGVASPAPRFGASRWSWPPGSHPAWHTISRDAEGVLAYYLQRIVGTHRVDRPGSHVPIIPF